MREYSSYPVSSSRPVATAIAEGRPLLLPEISDDDLRKIAENAEHLELLRRLGSRSGMVVPFHARGRVLGAIALMVGDSGRRYTATDLALAQELARRAAVAIDNALLYRESQQAIRVRNDFLSVAAHELKTPTTAIKAYAQLLRRRMSTGREPGEVEALETINQQADHLARLVQQLLDLSRLEYGRLELHSTEVDLVQIVENVLKRTELVTPDRRLQLESKGPVVVTADPDRIEQVIGNLLDNAIKFSPAGGTIRTSIDAAGDGAVVSVQDWGMGVPEGRQSRVFERYYRAHEEKAYEGLGIGLHVAREIIAQHGGEMWFESREGEGSTFYFSLPLAGAPSTQGDGRPTR